MRICCLDHYIRQRPELLMIVFSDLLFSEICENLYILTKKNIPAKKKSENKLTEYGSSSESVPVFN
jgi:hypothetical protein